jgi:hypothetical protein
MEDTMSNYYTFTHHAGYGRGDHLADEVIARALGAMGYDTGDRLLAATGFAAHSCPMPGIDVRIDAAPGI